MSSTAPPSDLRKLVAEARAGDADAWEALYRRTYPRLLAYARRRTPPSQCEDIVSEVMTRAVHKIDTFTWQGGGFDAWLYGIARYVVLEHRRERHPVPHPDPSAGVLAPDEPSEHAEVLDRRKALEQAFGMLSEDDQELLELRVVGELSAIEVGTIVGRNPGAVRMGQSRALKRLHSHMGALGHNE